MGDRNKEQNRKWLPRSLTTGSKSIKLNIRMLARKEKRKLLVFHT